MFDDVSDDMTLEMAEAVIAAHKAAKRSGDLEALSLIEPLLRYAGRCLAERFREAACCPELQLDDARTAPSASASTIKASIN